MSQSETSSAELLIREIAELDRLAGDVIASGQLDRVPHAELRRLIDAATRLYAAACEREGVELRPVSPAVSTTEAVRLSVALARSQDLSPFDLALWFHQLRPADGD
jgi:hypothetical protein